MVSDHQSAEGHERFRELTALAGLGTLTPLEWSQLKAHLEVCDECREASLQYLALAREGIPVLAAAYTEQRGRGNWGDMAVRAKLMARVQGSWQSTFELDSPLPIAAKPSFSWRVAMTRFAQAALAASLVLAIGLGAYHRGARTQTRAALGAASAEQRVPKLVAENQSEEEVLAAQAKKLTRLREESARKEQEVARLRSELRALEDHSNQLVAANNQSEGQLQAISRQRDSVNTQLQEAIQTCQNLRAELASLSAERDKALLRTTFLEAKLEELTALNRDQERRLKDAEQYLASDRDIRELMGARQLYIADVFDVDSGSRTRKPYGRVFYTQGKSLIFYAFDLDREPGFVNASTFQVWGQKETAQREGALPLNLGILYMDNEANRRWVMRFDDPKRLAEIDAVFVTVEPHGGSHKPTSKPFLYALLRNEVNHP